MPQDEDSEPELLPIEDSESEGEDEEEPDENEKPVKTSRRSKGEKSNRIHLDPGEKAALRHKIIVGFVRPSGSRTYEFIAWNQNLLDVANWCIELIRNAKIADVDISAFESDRDEFSRILSEFERVAEEQERLKTNICDTELRFHYHTQVGGIHVALNRLGQERAELRNNIVSYRGKLLGICREVFKRTDVAVSDFSLMEMQQITTMQSGGVA